MLALLLTFCGSGCTAVMFQLSGFYFNMEPERGVEHKIGPEIRSG